MSAANTQNTAYSRFAFDTVFDAGGHIVRSASRKNEMHNLEEVAALEAKAYERGLNDATARAAQEFADAMGTLARLSQMLLGRLATEAETLRNDATSVALAAAKSIAGRALDQFGEEAVLGAIQEALSQLRTAPRLLIRVAPHLEGGLSPRIQDMAEQSGLTGAIVVRADASIAVGDVHLDWADGSIQHDQSASFALIEAAAAKWLATQAQEDLQFDLFSPHKGASL
jgi:flagellar assembly protein FliH